jgi:uncharacterized phage protein gp47/JayE
VASQADVASQMIAVLAASVPDLDTSLGSVVRKIIDVVAASVSSATIDQQMLAYSYDVTSKAGADLDAFVQLFGLSRYPAARSYGTVTFTRGTATDVVTIPVATQVATADGTVVIQTVTAGILNPGALSVTLPVQAVIAGPAGNAAAGSLTQLLTPVSEVSGVTNLNALSGGASQEADAQLQARWSATAFRSMAGTSQMFLGIALADPECTAANVIDGATRYREQLQVSGGQAATTIPDAQFTYPAGQVVGRDIDNGDVAAPGLQYTWNSAASPPSVQVVDASYFPQGQLIDVSFLYMDAYSRNSPAQGIYSRVDVWCSGQRPMAAAASLRFSAATVFSASGSSPWYAGSFTRPDGSSPAPGNAFIALPWGPVLTVPPVMVVNGVTYGQATLAQPLGSVAGGVSYAYQVAHRTGAFGWSPYSDFGLEWAAGMQPPGGTPLTISDGYTYNDVPAAIQKQLENWRLAGTDVQAHQAIQLQLQFSLAVVYDPGATPATAQAAVTQALSSWLGAIGFGAVVYPSSVLQAVEGTPGITACRFLTGADYPGFTGAAANNYDVGIQQVLGGVTIASYVDSAGNPLPVTMAAAALPVLGGVVLVTKAINTLGAFA